MKKINNFILAHNNKYTKTQQQHNKSIYSSTHTHTHTHTHTR